jgi:hypothetical protein
MPTEPRTATLAEVVRAGAEAADPSGADPLVTDLIMRFEDRDEPVTAVLGDVEQQLTEARAIIDLDGDSEALSNAVAVAIYLAFRRDEIGDDPEDLIRLATRAEDVT